MLASGRRSFLTVGLLALVAGCGPGEPQLTPTELGALRSLSMESLAPLPESPSNRVADDERAARLGHRLFFDPELSTNDQISCATCHQSQRFFSDGLERSVGIGTLQRNAPTVVGAAYSPWQFWDGRRDSLWAQALSPLESADEMGTSRVEVLRLVASRPEYEAAYRELFGPLPSLEDLPRAASPFGDEATRAAWAKIPVARQRELDEAFSLIGKCLEAYQRKLLPGPGRFDRAVAALVSKGSEARGASDGADLLTEDEWEGARLFVDPGRTLCLRCHNGPLLTNNSFHRIGTDGGGPLPDLGRFLGIQAVLLDPFNCVGPFSDADPDACSELRFLARRHLESQSGAFKTPTLRGLLKTAPYMHDGSFATLEAVMEHYRDPPQGPHELTPLELTDREITQLVAFLGSLGSEVASDERWLRPPE